MADTIRPLGALQALLADNTTGAISPQKLRDFLVSAMNSYQEQGTFGYKDLKAPLTNVTLGPINSPTFAAFRSGLYAYQFAEGDEVFFTFHVPHDVRPGSVMVPHVHWTTNGTSTQQVGWDFEYSYARGFNQEAFPTTSTISLAEAASGTAWQHMTTEAASGITVTEPDGLIVVRLARNATGTNTDNVFGLQCDLHYEVDRLCTPNKTPDFYGHPASGN